MLFILTSARLLTPFHIISITNSSFFSSVIFFSLTLSKKHDTHYADNFVTLTTLTESCILQKTSEETLFFYSETSESDIIINGVKNMDKAQKIGKF